MAVFLALLVALFCFVIAQFEAALGPVDLHLAGLAALTVAFMLGSPVVSQRRNR